MKCSNCGKYVDRHNLKDAKNCLRLSSQKIVDMKQKLEMGIIFEN